MSDDIWVYRAAGSPGTDPLLRCWGDGAKSVDTAIPPGHEFSYSYLRWSLPENLSGNYTVISAVLHLQHQPYPSYTQELGEQYPLEARALNSAFSESTWLFNNALNPQPGSLYGNADLSQYATETAFPVTINLLQTTGFEAIFNTAVASDKKLAVALTSALPAFGIVGSPIYRIYAKEAGAGIYAPKLTLTIEPGNSSAISLPQVKGQTSGVQISATGVVSFASSLYGAFWLQDTVTRTGIMVLPASNSSLPTPGDMVTVTGTTSTIGNAEAALTDASWTAASVGNIVTTGLQLRLLGGLQTGIQPKAAPSQTINTVGMLVRAAGTVTNTGAANYWGNPVNTFRLTDGSSEVEIATPNPVPASGSAVSVTGIVRAVNDGNETRAVIAASSILTVAP